MTRYRLLQARLPGDPVRLEERRAFAARLGVRTSALSVHDLLEDPLDVEAVTDGVDAILIGGSGAFSVTSNPPWLHGFFDLLGDLVERGTPTFASCFGFQALVVALGGDVRMDEQGAEVGTFEVTLAPEAAADPLFSILPHRFAAQQGHKDRAFRLPSGVVNLARSERSPYQALRITGRPVWATQFHPELTADDNRTRFERYFAMYSHAFGPREAQRMLDAFRPSPEANSLLRSFHVYVAGPNGGTMPSKP